MNKQGCGLGLFISKHLANALGGDIKGSSTLGRGSSFILTITEMKTDYKQTFLSDRSNINEIYDIN